MTSVDQQPGADPGVCSCLTLRERQLLTALADGSGTESIAAALGLTDRTVRNYMSRIYLKTGASNRVQAALWWQRHTASGTSCGEAR